MLKQVLDWSCGIYIFFLWNEFFCISRRDLALKRMDNQASVAQIQDSVEAQEGSGVIKQFSYKGHKKSDLDLAPDLIDKLNKEIEEEIRKVNSILKISESEPKA